jgi:hypothetical protein
MPRYRLGVELVVRLKKPRANMPPSSEMSLSPG